MDKKRRREVRGIEEKRRVHLGKWMKRNERNLKRPFYSNVSTFFLNPSELEREYVHYAIFFGILNISYFFCGFEQIIISLDSL